MNTNRAPQSQPVQAQALQSCIAEALAEAPGLVMRWINGLTDELRLQESWAVTPMQKAPFITAAKELGRQKEAFSSQWVDQWRRAIREAIQSPGDAGGGGVKRSLSNISFDELELMDETQVQATVQVARLEQVVQTTTSGDLSDLTALLSRAQGFSAVKPEHNPLRPDVAVKALRQTMEALTRDRNVRNLWLQHGTQALGRELQVLYKHLIRILADHGVKPGDYQVVQAPTSPVAPRTGGRQRPVGLADQEHLVTPQAISPPPPVASDLLTLDYLHELLVTGPGELTPIVPPSPDPFTGPAGGAFPPVVGAGGFPRVPPAPQASPASKPNRAPLGATPTGALPAIDPMVGAASVAASPVAPPVVAPAAPPKPYRGPDRRKRAAAADAEAGEHLKALAGTVVALMVEGMSRDVRLLAPVRQVLQDLQPALTRIANDDPRFFVDRQNPARRLLDEMTQRSLAFASESTPGFAAYRDAMEDVVQLFQRTDVPVTAQFETALAAIEAFTHSDAVQAAPGERSRAVASLVQVEQRFLMAEKVAAELADRKDFSRAAPFVQAFLKGPWSQVIAHARIDPTNGGTTVGRVPADIRYLGAVTDLIWSSRAEAASRNRGRLARLIPGLLRTLREGLQTVELDAEASRTFFATLMAIHEAALKAADGVDVALDLPDLSAPEWPSAARDAAAPAADIKPPRPANAGTPWVKSREAADSGFMDLPLPELSGTDFADTLPERQNREDPATAADAQPPADPPLPVGTWVELRRDSGDWIRLQLTWSSPHGTLYLFNGNGGRTTSMTRQNVDQLMERGRMRLVATQSVVDDALTGVVDLAVRNSTRVAPTPSSRASTPPAPLAPAPARVPPSSRPDTQYPDLLPPLA